MNIDDLLAPLSPDQPTGEECLYKPRFRELAPLCEFLVAQAELAELERRTRFAYEGEGADADRRFAADALEAARTRLDKQLAGAAADVLGGAPTSHSAARLVVQRTHELLAQVGKDLAVVQRACLGAVALHGIGGLVDGLRLFEALLDRFGADLYPQPDGDDQSERAILLGELLDGQGLESLLRETVIVSAGPGRMCFRDAEVLDGALPPDPSGAGLTNAQHLAAIVSADIAREQQIKPEAVSVAQKLARIDAMLAPLGSATTLLNALAKRLDAPSAARQRVPMLLSRAARHLQALRTELGVQDASAAVAAVLADGTGSPDAVALGSGGAPAYASAAAGAAVALGNARLASRDDARRAILEVAEFLERSEPAHPAPMFLRRAARLLQARSFYDLVQDLLPGSPVDEIAHLTGQKPPEPANEDSG